jgi:hypothetical protein
MDSSEQLKVELKIKEEELEHMRSQFDQTVARYK